MAVISELLRSEEDGTISFGDYTLSTKAKLDNFEHQGDLYKVKTCQEITKLERNGMFVYESVPGTAVEHLKATDTGMEFSVEGAEDAQVTVELEDEAEYDIVIEIRLHRDRRCRCRQDEDESRRKVKPERRARRCSGKGKRSEVLEQPLSHMTITRSVRPVRMDRSLLLYRK